MSGLTCNTCGRKHSTGVLEHQATECMGPPEPIDWKRVTYVDALLEEPEYIDPVTYTCHHCGNSSVVAEEAHSQREADEWAIACGMSYREDGHWYCKRCNDEIEWMLLLRHGEGW